MDKIQVPVTTEDGHKKGEEWREGEAQSDGSTWHRPVPLVDPEHEHSFVLANPGDRTVHCECGHGGDVFPHTTVIRDGHVFTLEGVKII